MISSPEMHLFDIKLQFLRSYRPLLFFSPYYFPKKGGTYSELQIQIIMVHTGIALYELVCSTP